jgi:hypothetical protein
MQTSTDMLYPLLHKIWKELRVPKDWKKGHTVKLSKKGDLSSCNNCGAIMMLSIPRKCLTTIILERLKAALDNRLRHEHAGFQADRSCLDHIAKMCIIIDRPWCGRHPPLYSVFVDFQKAFDNVNRDVIWKLMHHHGFPPKFIIIIKQLYEDAICQVILMGS